MTRVLLITGARSLADDRDAEAWARGLIAAALVGVDLLIVGDADGPDEWAWDEAITAGTSARHRYYARGDSAGWIEVWDGHPLRFSHGALQRWATPAMWRKWGRRFPLERNAAMVAECRVRVVDDGADVSVLALLDGRKPAVVKPGEKRPTRGTEHTARLARAAGLTVDAQTWGSR